MSNIHQLIDKYFQGETTLEEETLLRAYFNQEDIAPELKAYQPLFGLLESERSQKVGEHFDTKVYQTINAAQKKTPLLYSLHRWAGAVAASMILVLSIWYLYPGLSPEPASAINWEQYEPKDPQEAFRITKEALMKVSVELNRGAEKAAKEVGGIKDFLKE